MRKWRIDIRELYDVSIDVLELSDEAKTDMLRIGITTVGDCLDHFARIPDAMIQIRGRTWQSLKEVEQRLITENYLPENWFDLNTVEDE